MSESRIVVPDGMLTAAMHAIGIPEQYKQTHQVNKALEAALRWLSENPIVPTDEQVKAIHHSATEAACTSKSILPFFAIEWQRRMFLAPEPEIPEDIRDLIYGDEVAATGLVKGGTFDESNQRVLEAYRRGQKSKSV